MKAIPYLLLLLLLTVAPSVSAQELVWAADAEGGAPYSFPDVRNPARIIGFEVDLASSLAARLGRKAKFQQNQWDGLVPGLERGEYDVVINGLEITADRAEKIAFSIPYFYSTLTLTTRLDESRIFKADDLKGKTVGTLKVTVAERFLQGLGGVNIRSYENQGNAYTDLLLGRLDAVVMDTPIATYYAYSPQYRNVELNSVRMSYGVGIRKTDDALLQQVNSAIAALQKDGTLKKIYQDWGLYNAPTAQAFGDEEAVSNGAAPR